MIGADGLRTVLTQFPLVLASKYVLIRDRMASLRLENFDLSLMSNASTSSLGALNSTSSISCLTLFSLLGKVELLTLQLLSANSVCQPKEK